MTATQQARIEGFRLHLAERGISLRVEGDASAVFSGLVETISPMDGERLLDRDEATAAFIHVLREDFEAVAAQVSPNCLLIVDGADTAYRVSEISDEPQNVAIRMRCRSSTNKTL